MPDLAQWVEAVAAAAKPYIFGNAAQFAGQLWAFIASGMSVAAHDAAVFGTDQAPGAAASASATEGGGPSNRHGWHSSEGSSSHSRGERHIHCLKLRSNSESETKLHSSLHHVLARTIPVAWQLPFRRPCLSRARGNQETS